MHEIHITKKYIKQVYFFFKLKNDLYKRTQQEVLERHNMNKADELVILGGFFGPKPVEELAEISPSISCKIIHGCFKDQAPDEITHKKYQEITNNTKVKVFYKNNYNHSKIYMWSKNKNPVDILIGSANFSSRGLYNDGQETLSDIPFTDYNSIDTIIKKALSDSQICSSYIIKPKIKIPSMVSPSPVLKLDEIVSIDPPHVRIFLGYKAGLIPEKSGLNWGFSSGHVAPDTSYLPLRSDLMQLIPGFYPFNGKNLEQVTVRETEIKNKLQRPSGMMKL